MTSRTCLPISIPSARRTRDYIAGEYIKKQLLRTASISCGFHHLSIFAGKMCLDILTDTVVVASKWIWAIFFLSIYSHWLVRRRQYDRSWIHPWFWRSLITSPTRSLCDIEIPNHLFSVENYVVHSMMKRGAGYDLFFYDLPATKAIWKSILMKLGSKTEAEGEWSDSSLPPFSS